MKKILAVMFLVLVLGAFIWKGSVGLDPDFGWHIRSGEYILENGIPSFDPLSYTMPSFPFIDHAWGSSILFFLFYPVVSLCGLSFLLSFLLLISLFYLIYNTKENASLTRFAEICLSPLFIIGIALLYSFFFVRAQVFSWVLWSVFVSIFVNKSLWNKYKLLLPVLFIVWVNLHGGFALGIFSLLIYTFSHFYKKSLKRIDLMLVSLCIFATFMNPYGIYIWKEVFMTISSPLLRQHIDEWKSLVFSPDVSLLCFMLFSSVSIIHFRKKIPFEQLFLFWFLLMQSILSVKNIPFWIILTLPLITKTMKYFYDEISLIPHGEERFKKFANIFLPISLSILLLSFFTGMGNAYTIQESAFYPKNAIKYLQANKNDTGHIFSEYGWGGYLDWKYPSEKVFVDGRMAIWREDSLPKNELSNVFQTYLSIANGTEQYKTTFTQFNITWVLLPKVKNTSSLFSQLASQFSLITNRFVSPPNTFNLIDTIKVDGWQNVYEDEISVVYQKPENY
jgi:hypothetical protein